MNSGKVSLDTKLPIFDRKNWNRWSIQMHVLFRDQDVLDLINDSYTSIAKNITGAQINAQCETRKKDQKELFYIYQCMDTKVFRKIVDSSTVKAAWIH